MYHSVEGLTELALSPICQSQDTKKIRRKYIASFVLPSFVFFVSCLTIGRRAYRVATYFEKVEGTPFLFVSSFYLPTYLQRYVGDTYKQNSDKGLTDLALNTCNINDNFQF
jgi:hypothetical protein